MAAGGTLRETEIKLALDSARQGRRLLLSAGFRVSRRRVHERNSVFDTPGRALRSRGELLRLREAGGRTLLTFKGRATARKHKSRIEYETSLSDPQMMRAVLARLGFKPVFRYEKHRTEYCKLGWPGVAALDETPIGVFLELEAQPAWIGHAAKSLGFSEKSYITDSYVTLYNAYRRRHGGHPQCMVLPADPSTGGHRPSRGGISALKC